ncbi:hypothetical protein IFR04_004197 [Cadophora malorum]|uniref:Uncharacterized protein n=1 Tax=Cadophora malorum TaxID=108018 RepID=A0A8H7WDB0_9HELO|nr:hypothetical protein IFR04_004197 [Cadophora malorum]
MATSASPSITTYGATATTFITTTISLSTIQASFTILYPPPTTEAVQYTTFSAVENPRSTFTPSPLPVLVLTNVVGIAVNPSGSPVATRTLNQTPPPQATNRSTSIPQVVTCPSWKWTCWPLSKQVGIGLAIGLGTLLLLFLWWLLFWRPRIKKIRIRRGRPGDEEGGEGRPPLKIAVRTSMSQTRSRSQGARNESLSLSPPAPVRGSGGVRVVPGSTAKNGGVKDPPAYRVVRQPSPREFLRPVSMPDGPVREDADGTYETRVREFAVPAAAATVGAGVGNAVRSRRESRSGGVRVSRGESLRDSRGSRRERMDSETRIEMRERSERRKDHQKEERYENERRRNRSHRGREEEFDDRRSDRRSRRNSYAARDEEDFDVRGDRNLRRRSSEPDGDKRRPRR